MSPHIRRLVHPLTAASALTVLSLAAFVGAQPAIPPATPPAVPSVAPSATPPAAPSVTPSATPPEAEESVIFPRLRDALKEGRMLRCKTALCWGGGGTKWAIEPLVELPIGKTFTLTDSTLDRWINTHELTVSFAGGLRFWGWDDLVSLSVYFSQPLTNSTGYIHVQGSEFEYPVSNIRRPYPGAALGLFGDTVWIGLDYQELINGDARGNLDRNYPPSALVSRSVSLTIGLATVSSIRWGIGTLASRQVERARAQDVKAAATLASDATKAAAAATTAAESCQAPTKAAEDAAKAAVDPATREKALTSLRVARTCLKAAAADARVATAEAANARTTAAAARKETADALMLTEETKAKSAEDTALAAAAAAKAATQSVDALDKKLDAAESLLLR